MSTYEDWKQENKLRVTPSSDTQTELMKSHQFSSYPPPSL